MGVHISFVDKHKNIKFRGDFERIIKSILSDEGKKLGDISYIFTSNNYIFEINKKFLKHEYFTDVITFSESRKNNLSGDIYISLDQIKINADIFGVSPKNELARVIIHGALHLIGYNDKTEIEQKLMREREDTYLCRFNWNDIIAESETDL